MKDQFIGLLRNSQIDKLICPLKESLQEIVCLYVTFLYKQWCVHDTCMLQSFTASNCIVKF